MPKVPLVAPASKPSGNDCISVDLAASYVIVSLVHTTIKLTNPKVSVADVVVTPGSSIRFRVSC